MDDKDTWRFVFNPDCLDTCCDIYYHQAGGLEDYLASLSSYFTNQGYEINSCYAARFADNKIVRDFAIDEVPLWANSVDFSFKQIDSQGRLPPEINLMYHSGEPLSDAKVGCVQLGISLPIIPYYVWYTWHQSKDKERYAAQISAMYALIKDLCATCAGSCYVFSSRAEEGNPEGSISWPPPHEKWSFLRFGFPPEQEQLCDLYEKKVPFWTFDDFPGDQRM